MVRLGSFSACPTKPVNYINLYCFEEQPRSASGGWVRSDVRMESKTVVITGANQGIGYETALDLAGRGARVIMTCRRTDAGEEARSKVGFRPKKRLFFGRLHV